MANAELTDEEAVTRVLRIIATRHAKRAMENPPDLNDPAAVIRWMEATARAAEEEFDQLMGYLPPAADARRSRVRELMA
ncbi:MAG: hypothetical protein HUU15_00830 [Candidatus Brocadiae bacterium]|nr:hypothetical protein [Candidatus Brocadiia bacterium]